MKRIMRGLMITLAMALLFSGAFGSYADRLQGKAALPNRATHVKVALVDYRYVTLYDYGVDGAQYYEIYGYIGDKSPAKLRENKYRDFTFLESTSGVRHRITRLEQYLNMDEEARAHFVIRAVNAAGAADFSNIVSLKATVFKNYKTLTYTKIDDNLLADAPSIDARCDDQKLTVTVSEYAHLDGRTFNYSGLDYSCNSLNVVAPDLLISRGRGQVKLATDFLTLDYRPHSLDNREFIINDTVSREYVTLKLDWQQTEATAAALAKLPKQLRPASAILDVSAQIANNGGARDLGAPVGDLKVHFNGALQGATGAADYAVYYFAQDLGVWLPVATIPERDDATFDIAAMGYYLLVEPIESVDKVDNLQTVENVQVRGASEMAGCSV